MRGWTRTRRVTVTALGDTGVATLSLMLHEGSIRPLKSRHAEPTVGPSRVHFAIGPHVHICVGEPVRCRGRRYEGRHIPEYGHGVGVGQPRTVRVRWEQASLGIRQPRLRLGEPRARVRVGEPRRGRACTVVREQPQRAGVRHGMGGVGVAL